MRVFIVTISESTPCLGNNVSVKAFSSREKAEASEEYRMLKTITKKRMVKT